MTNNEPWVILMINPIEKASKYWYSIGNREICHLNSFDIIISFCQY